MSTLLGEGTLILAGRTLTDAADRFGIVIIRAADDDAARHIMGGDPAVTEGIMTARLFPYRVALMEGREE